MRESLRSIVGDDVEKRVDIGLAKDGSGVGGMPSSLFCSHVCFCFGVLDKSLVSLHLSLLLAIKSADVSLTPFFFPSFIAALCALQALKQM